MISKILKYIIDYYFLIFAIQSITLIRFGISCKLDTLFLLSSLIVGFRSFKKNRSNFESILLILITFYLLLSWLLFNRDVSYLNVIVRTTIVPMLFFFIGKNSIEENIPMLHNMKYVFVAICIIALYLYFMPPSWYTLWKISNMPDYVYSLSSSFYQEYFRLSGFWNYPYFISYGCCLFFIYFLYNIKMHNSLYFIISIFIVILSALLAMQRVALAFMMLYFVFYHFSIFQNKNKIVEKKYLLRFDLFLLILLSISITYILSIISLDTIDYITNKFIEKDNSNLISERWGMFSNIQTNFIGLFGDGIGSHGRDAKVIVSDCQYLSIYYELGLIGCCFYGILAIGVFKRILKTGKLLFVESSVVLFYFISMIGANPLNSPDLHTPIFWYCVGRLYNGNLINIKAKNIIRTT
ncbi:hypothetical protein [uncultured Bacteroides sp.]|uniref:hypothetical protein n=1 Tax=uncultured Bacteroides sp. TaxID=162156 RepID=UPI0026227361|nr:hypothetical protein [uncultured Bacteroides sp.]